MQRPIRDKSSKFKKQHYLNGNFHKVFDQVIKHDRRNVIVELFIFMAGMEPKQLTAAFGRHDFIYEGGRRCKCWLFSHRGHDFLLASAKERGTTVECAQTVATDTIQSFLQEVVNRLQELDDERVKVNGIILNK